MPESAMQTFAISAPKETHTVPATCEEVECPQYARGWQMKIDLGTPLGQQQARYIKYSSGRSYKIVEQRDGLVTLEFKGGQPCFREHRKRIDRPEKFLVKGGDFRGNPLRTPTRVHKKPEFWVEEFAENQERLKTQIERG
jgi:hypothetical protein